jgi:hypothetical protein
MQQHERIKIGAWSARSIERKERIDARAAVDEVMSSGRIEEPAALGETSDIDDCETFAEFMERQEAKEKH